MKHKVLSLLLALFMMTAAAGVFAQGQAKTGVCHLDEDGIYRLISIADPALDRQIARAIRLPDRNRT